MGLLLPEDGELHPARYVQGIAQAAVNLGATIYPETPALSITENIDGASVNPQWPDFGSSGSGLRERLHPNPFALVQR